MSIINVAPNLHEIRLGLKGTHFTLLLSSWLYKDKDLCFLVDPGPSSVTNSLKQALGSLKIKKKELDYILLTHIHMDHAGGTGKLIKSFPYAQVICHPNGIKHMINPKKLWEGSQKVLGDVAHLYGEIPEIPEDRIMNQEFVANDKIEVVEKLGHAPHHQSYLFDKFLFAGEVAGVNLSFNNKIYTRPATPPIFNYEISIASIQTLLERNLTNHMICYAHFGMWKNADFYLRIAKKQLSIWIQIVEELLQNRNDLNFLDQVIQQLNIRDKYFLNMELIDQSIRNKELYFIKNCIKGIEGYIKIKNKK
jgi:glyoxylase-like metal-dependent hydrolase (beta-lactamase superfamily II)